MSKNPLIKAAEEKVAQNTKQVAVQNYTQGNGDYFQNKWNMAQALALSSFVPDNFRGKVADVMIAMELSEKMRLTFFTIIQNIDIIKGKPGWKATFVIALINSSGKYSSKLKFEWQDNENISLKNPKCRCRAYIQEHDGSLTYGAWISIEMAIKEGWSSKKNVEYTKWETMPEQMLMFRASSFFSRVHCPELLHGLQTSDEIVATVNVTEDVVEQSKDILPPANVTVEEAVESKRKEIEKNEEIVCPQAFKEQCNEKHIEQDIIVESMKDLKSSLSLLGFKVMQIKQNSKQEKWAQIVAADDEADFEEIMSIQGMKKINPNDSFFVMNVTNLE